MDESIYFRIAPELRRCAWYVLTSAPVIALSAFVMRHFALGENVFSAACTAGGMLIFFSILAAIPLRWSLRLDDQGIARRLLLRWDLWTWQDIVSGRIKKGDGHALRDPTRPWWRRTLGYNSMARTDIVVVMQWINKYYQLPPPPELPDVLEIKYGTLFRRRARFDFKGVHLHGAQELHEYLWSQVRRVHITRIDPVRRDFRRLEIVLPDQEIELSLVSTQGGTSLRWRGADAEVIAEFLARYVPSEHVDVDIVAGRPSRKTDVVRQVQRAQERYRYVYRANLILLLFAVGCLIWMAVHDGIGKALSMAVLFAILLMPGYYGMQRISRSQWLKLQHKLTVYDDDGPT